MNSQEEEYLTVVAAALYLGVSRDKVHDMFAQKDMPLPFVIDPLDRRRKLIKKSDLDARRRPGVVITPDNLDLAPTK